jgi:integrase
VASIQAKKTESGSKTHYVVVSHAGKHKWIRAGSLKAARLLKREIEALAETERLQRFGFGTRVKRVDTFFQEYLENVRLRTSPNTVKRYRAAVNAFIAFLKLFHPEVLSLNQVLQEHIEGYQQKRLESVELKSAADGEKLGTHKRKRLPKPQTVNYEVGVLRSALLWAYDRELIVKVPTRKVKKLRPTPKRKARILTEEECRLLLAKAREMAKRNSLPRAYSLAFQFLLNTGLRAGELCSLTWEDVDLENGLIHIRAKPGWTPKTYERSILLNETGRAVLTSLPVAEGYVFREPLGVQLKTDDLRRALIKVASEARVDGLTRVHDLRHTFSSLLQMRGVDRGTVATILGHRDIATTAIYTHQTTEHLKKSIDKIGIK